MVSLESLEKEYEALIPPEDREIEVELDKLDKLVMRGALAERFPTMEEIQKRLDVATALFGRSSGKARKWPTIVKNLENVVYNESKQLTIASGEKFVSAAADREASLKANSARVLESFYASCLERCEQHIMTAKKHMGDEKKDSRNG
jgi:hypothetical protein